MTVYRSSKAGPLGKPKAIKSHSGWDPTDPAKGNPSFKLKKAVITIKKSKQVEYGTAIRLKQGVTAKNPNANESLTSRIQVAAVQYCNTKTGKYVKKAFSSRRTGKWRVTYRVTYPYCRSAKKTFTFKVADTSKPVLKHAKKRTLTVGEADAVRNVAR